MTGYLDGGNLYLLALLGIRSCSGDYIFAILPTL